MQMPLGPAELHVLLALSRQPMHGLAIAEDIADVTGDAVILGPATLYRTIKEMTHARLIVRVRRSREGDPRRKVYALTPKGLERLRDGMAVVQRMARCGGKRLDRLRTQPGALSP